MFEGINFIFQDKLRLNLMEDLDNEEMRKAFSILRFLYYDKKKVQQRSNQIETLNYRFTKEE